MNSINKIFFLLILITSSCQSALQYDQLAKREMFSFAREVKTTDNLHLMSYGGGFFDRINDLKLTFLCIQYLNIEETRNLYFNISNRFLKRINENEGIREYLANYPFTDKNLDLVILFPDAADYVSAISMGDISPSTNRDFIFYFGYDPYKDTSFLIHKETYQSAKEIYDQQGCLRDEMMNGT